MVHTWATRLCSPVSLSLSKQFFLIIIWKMLNLLGARVFQILYVCFTSLWSSKKIHILHKIKVFTANRNPWTWTKGRWRERILTPCHTSIILYYYWEERKSEVAKTIVRTRNSCHKVLYRLEDYTRISSMRDMIGILVDIYFKIIRKSIGIYIYLPRPRLH